MSDEKNQNEEGAKQTPGDHWGSLVDDIGATPADDASTHPSETVGTDESESSAGDSGAGADSGFVNQLFGLRESEGESAVDAGEAGEEAVSEDRETPDEVAVKTNEKVHKAPFGAGLIEDIGLDAISESTANAADDTTVESPASEVVQADQIAEFSPPPTPRRPKLRSAPKSKGRLGWSSLADELGIDTEELAAAEELIESAASAEDEGEDVPTTGADAVVEVEASIDEAVEVTGFVEEVVDVLEDGTSDDGASDGDTPETSDERESTPFGTGILAPDELEAAEAALSSAAPDHRDEDKSSQNTAAQLPTGDARPSRRHKPKSAFGDGLGLDLGPDPHAKSEAEEELPEEAQPEKVPRFEKRQSEDRGGKSSRSREVVSRADSLSDELDGSADFDDDEFGGDDSEGDDFDDADPDDADDVDVFDSIVDRDEDPLGLGEGWGAPKNKERGESRERAGDRTDRSRSSRTTRRERETVERVDTTTHEEELGGWSDLEDDVELEPEGEADSGDERPSRRSSSKTSQRKYPTWEETVGAIVSGNMKSRGRSGGRRGRRGRRSGKRSE